MGIRPVGRYMCPAAIRQRQDEKENPMAMDLTERCQRQALTRVLRPGDRDLYRIVVEVGSLSMVPSTKWIISGS